jgi:hypothetical protein
VLKDEIVRGATVLEAKPTIISYTPSHRCNIPCTHCYQESTRDAEIKRADAAEEIERLAPHLVKLIAGRGAFTTADLASVPSQFRPEEKPLSRLRNVHERDDRH